MQKPFSIVGGARIGWTGFSWPLARLSATSNELVIKVLFDAYTFAPGDVVAIDRHKGIFSRGIRIRHQVTAYPENIIFWSNPEKAFGSIRDSGFVAAAG
jgi:hypothetical protein